MTNVGKICAPSLGEIGFRKRAGNIFTTELAEDVIGTLGLNTATEGRPPGEVAVNPIVGVRHQGVERIVAECKGVKFHPYSPPIVCEPIGYLMPARRFRQWEFRDDDTGATVARDLSAAVEHYGLEFMRSAATLERIGELIDARVGHPDVMVYRRPVVKLLTGGPEEALDAIATMVQDLGDRDDAAAENVRRFAQALRKRIQE